LTTAVSALISRANREKNGYHPTDLGGNPLFLACFGVIAL
jgi:hypothetical protein